MCTEMGGYQIAGARFLTVGMGVHRYARQEAGMIHAVIMDCSWIRLLELIFSFIENL